MIEWFLEKFMESTDHMPETAIYPYSSVAEYLIKKGYIDKYLNISCFIDENPKKLNKTSYEIISPIELQPGHNILIISNGEEENLKKNLIELIGKKHKIYCFFNDFIYPNVNNAIKRINKQNNNKISLLINDLKDWDAFITSCCNDDDNIIPEKDYEELKPLLHESQIFEIWAKKYFCRCYKCGEINSFSTIFVDVQHYYICFFCNTCKSRWIRIQYFRWYNHPFIYIPSIDKIIYNKTVKAPLSISTISELAKEAIFILKSFILNYYSKLNNHQQCEIKDNYQDNNLYIFTNRIHSIWHAFLDEWIILWRFSKTAFGKKHNIIAHTCEFVQETSKYITHCDEVKSFRKENDSYLEGKYKLNEYIQQNNNFYFSPVMKDSLTNNLYGFEKKMFKDWFHSLDQKAEKYKEQFHSYYPILFLYVRPYQQMVWYPQQEKINEFINLFLQKYKNGLIVLHGNVSLEKSEFYEKKSAWMNILNKKRVVNCINKNFDEQYIMNKICHIGLFQAGGGNTIVRLTNKPYIEIKGSYSLSTIIPKYREKIYKILHDNNDEYLALIDYVQEDDWNYYFDPEFVLSAVSMMLKKNRKKKGKIEKTN